MKAFVIALTLAYASLIGCVNAQQKAIKGSGNIVTEERNVALFDKIKASRSIHVFLTQGENFTVKVEAEDNILPYIETNVLNHLLHLTLQEGINVKSREDIKVHVTLPKITALHASNLGQNQKYRDLASRQSVSERIHVRRNRDSRRCQSNRYKSQHLGRNFIKRDDKRT